jgi:general secretion pathway protein A
MVLDYFKLREHPFGVTPDSRYLYQSVTHREALASLLYGIDAGCGFLALIATPGLGKTTLLFHLMNQLREKAVTVFLFQTVCTPMELLRAVVKGLGVQETQGSVVQMQIRLKDVLLEQAGRGKRVVVVIDEAQNLDDSVLELVRMLSNFETSRDKLIQIILSGQPQLAEKIGSPELEQLRQRVSILACLKPFSREDTELFIDHRLRIAGYDCDVPLFTKDALGLIAQHSRGIPRNINNLCFNSLSLACALKRRLIDADIVLEVIADLDLDRFRKKSIIAAGTAEKGPPAVPPFLYAAGAPSMVRRWVPRFAIAFAVVLALGGVLFVGRVWPTRMASGQMKNAARQTASTASAKAAPTPVDANQPAVPAGAVGQAASVLPPQVLPDSPSSNQPVEAGSSENTISVTPGKTLLGICVDNFGRCNSELLQEIRNLNPRLNNPDHIESGQKIRLPASGAVAEQLGKASLAESNAR